MHSRYLSSIVLAFFAPWMMAFSFVRATSWRHRHLIATGFFSVFGSVVLLEFGDGLDHQNALERYYLDMSFQEFASDLWNILTFQLTESRSKDVYIHVLSYVVGGVLGMPRLFFPVVATVYGYFFAGSVISVLKNFRLSDANYVIVAFVVVFLFVRGLEGFYTVRTWTGMWILVYSCLKYYETRQRRYLFLMFTPPLVHIGFFVIAIPAWTVLLFGSRPMLYSAIFVATSITTIMPVDDAADVLSRTERGASQVTAYRVEEQQVAMEEFERNRQTTNLYAAYQRAGVQRWAPTILVFALLLSGIYIRKMSAYQRRIFSVGILTLALSNATWFLYAVHNRSLIVAMVFLLAGFLIARLDPKTKRYFENLHGFYKWGLHLSIAFFIPLIVFNVSMTLDWMSVFIFGLPFIVWWDPELNMSVKELLNALIGRS